jgi:hypothetical protein
MQVDEQPRNTPFLDGPQKASINEALLEWLRNRYQTKDLVHVDPMACFPGHSAAPPRARCNVRVIPMRFEGCAAGFQLAADGGFQAKMTLADALGGMGPKVLKSLQPHRNPALDKKQGTSPEQHSLQHVYINNVSLAEPLNTLPLGVAIVSSTLPPVYSEMKKKQAQELYEELKVEAPNADILAHIPVSTDGKPDLRQIPVLKEVINAFHATEVCRTFGGITSEDLWRGLHFLSPQEAIQLGFLRPPVEHDFAEPPPGTLKAYNSWVIVPEGHILSFISNLPAANIRECGYVVDRLKMPLTGELLPFFVMDLWTVREYICSTVGSVMLNISRNRVSLADQWIEVVPLTHKRWIDACVAGEEYKMGAVSFKVVISYTTFPAVRREGEFLLPMLSDGFPRMDIEFKSMVDSEEIKKSVAPKKKQAMAAAQKGAPVGDADPLTVAKPADPMDMEEDADEGTEG